MRILRLRFSAYFMFIINIVFLASGFQVSSAFELDGPLPKEAMAGIKKVYEFDKWVGKVRYPDKEIKKLEFGKDFYNNFSNEMKILTSEKDRYKEPTIKLKDKKTSLLNIDVKILFVDAPNEAHQTMLNSMSLSTHPLPAYKKYDPNDPDLINFREPKDTNLPTIGDMCFIPINLWKPKNNKIPVINLLWFCRNNVLVKIRINAPENLTEYPNLIKMAELIDKKLLSILEPIDPNTYIPLCKAPEGFYLERAVCSKSTKDETISLEWALNPETKNLIIKKTDKTNKKADEKYPDSIEEYWIKNKERIDFFKFTCPDKKSLDETIELYMYKLYAVYPDEIEEPTIGERVLKYEDENSTLLASCSGLTFIRVALFSKIISKKDRLKLAENIIKDNLSTQFK